MLSKVIEVFKVYCFHSGENKSMRKIEIMHYNSIETISTIIEIIFYNST